MNSELPATAQREALNADITTARAELGRTLEAIAAKTKVKTRAKQAAREAAVGAKDRVAAGAQEVRTEVVGWWQPLRRLSARQRLSVAAMLAALIGGLSATAAALKSRSKGGCR